MNAARRKTIHDAMVRLADGDRSAMQVLLDELWPVILTFAQRGIRQEHDAEDIAQEVFLRICSRISDFDRSRDGVSWAFGIAGYEVLTYRRGRSRRRETLGDAPAEALEDPTASQESTLIERELVAALEQAIGTLSDEDRSSLGLRAAAGAVSAPTLRKRRQRALERLRAVWRTLYGEP